MWVQPKKLENWPTKIIDNGKLHCQLPVCEDWSTNPQVTINDSEIEHCFYGKSLAECLMIKFMEQANPNNNICNWVDYSIAITGFPILSIQQRLERPPSLLEWNYEGSYPYLTQKLAVDEVHLYQGLAKIFNPSTSMIRLYVLLARRDTFAWQIALSIYSACFPNTPKELVDSNDHFRAGSIFGNLKLL